MNPLSKSLIKSFIPPVVRDIVKNYKKVDYGWFGNYATWEDAKKDSNGYDSDDILNKVKNALLKVKNGEAIYERDSVLFDKVEYSWPLLASIMWVAAQNEGKLNILDFGGSLGSSYFQNKLFLQNLKQVNWNVIEQDNFVQCGREYFADDALKFYENIEACLSEQHPQVILLSCVLPYIAEPYVLLEKVFSHKLKYLILDRMPFIAGDQDRITVQKVPPTIYQASYPAWFFSKEKFINFIENKYKLITDFDCTDQANIKSEYKGLIMQLVK
jgi:putative methyltransferase (TIGR04325 family)